MGLNLNVRIRNQMVAVACISIAVAFLFSCEQAPKHKPPTLSGTFNGVSSDGTSVKVSFKQKDNRVTGGGTFGANAFSLSAITAWHGPMMIKYSDGLASLAHITLSPDGTTATISGLGLPIILNRESFAMPNPSGLFSGSYSGKAGRPPLCLRLFQEENLIAGTGVISGKPVAFVGKVSGAKQASGTVLLSDESQINLKVKLSDDNNTLTVDGLGSPFMLSRD